VIIEAGAEGFVTRSKVFPEIAKSAGIPADQLVNQIRIADNELKWDEILAKWEIRALEPGVAAQKLGFQVPKEDRGKGIRSFNFGMSYLVDSITRNIPDIRLSHKANALRTKSDLTLQVDMQSESSIEADHVVIATPLEAIRSILKTSGIECPTAPLAHHSHVSVHVLTPSVPDREPPKSFTVPAELQGSFGGLRAVSFVNEKFPNRCQDGYWLFRFYYRPPNEKLALEEQHWVSAMKRAMNEVYQLNNLVWYQYSPWISQLPTLTPEYLISCKQFKAEVLETTKGRVHLVGSEVTGAGLEAAATSGYDTALNIFDSCTV
jgi:oxygen-dependent protoporphyrinogen oxidase